jgi:hypothetical protein
MFRLKLILRQLRISSFGGKMSALNEVNRVTAFLDSKLLFVYFAMIDCLHFSGLLVLAVNCLTFDFLAVHIAIHQ